MIVGEENLTDGKRGFPALESETIDSGRCPNGESSIVAGDLDCRTGPCDWDSGEHCVFDIWVRVNRTFMWNAAHEMGHMLGFQHEHFRPDRDDFIETAACSTVLEWTDEEHLLSEEEFIGSYDVRSVMHYVDDYDPADPNVDNCFTSLPGAPIGGFRNKDLPTAQDLAKLQLLYGVRGDWVLDSDWCIRGGRQIHVGDFNGDGRQDLLCHSAEAGFDATGRRWLDFAGSDGAFDGTDSGGDTSQYCWGSSRRLLAGDFDGDGRDDAVCHDTQTGHRRIDLASADGDLKGTNWDSLDYGATTFCRGSHRTVYAADVNGDGADDLLCHNAQIGSVSVDLADPEMGSEHGVGLRGIDSFHQLAYCNADDAQLIVGTFDSGNARADLLCHNRVTGHKAILYGREDGTYQVPPGY